MAALDRLPAIFTRTDGSPGPGYARPEDDNLRAGESGVTLPANRLPATAARAGTTVMRKGWLLFVVGWLLILGGSWLASAIQTSGGIKVQDVRFAGTGGVTMSGL